MEDAVAIRQGVSCGSPRPSGPVAGQHSMTPHGTNPKSIYKGCFHPPLWYPLHRRLQVQAPQLRPSAALGPPQWQCVNGGRSHVAQGEGVTATGGGAGPPHPSTIDPPPLEKEPRGAPRRGCPVQRQSDEQWSPMRRGQGSGV